MTSLRLSKCSRSGLGLCSGKKPLSVGAPSAGCLVVGALESASSEAERQDTPPSLGSIGRLASDKI